MIAIIESIQISDAQAMNLVSLTGVNGILWVTASKNDDGSFKIKAETSDESALYETIISCEEKKAYSASALLDWCIDGPLQDAAFVSLSADIKMQALSFTQTFALNCNQDGASLYRKSAALLGVISVSSVPPVMAETVIAKAALLGADVQ